jgi:hypothetical protein
MRVKESHSLQDADPKDMVNALTIDIGFDINGYVNMIQEKAAKGKYGTEFTFCNSVDGEQRA